MTLARVEGTLGSGSGGEAGRLPWEPPLPWVSRSEDALEGNELTPPAR